MSDCIIWHKSKNDTGYGQIWVDGKRWRAHRLVWTQKYGPIPEGFVLDHICHNEAVAKGECSAGVCIHRACVNLEHLRLVTPGENVKAGSHGMDTKGACPKGHSYKDPNNIMVRANGRRECAQCNRERASMNYYKSKLVA